MVYHVIVILLSAAFAFSLPITAAFVANKLLAYWSFIGNEKIFLLSVEIGSAILLVLLFNHIRRYWQYRMVSRMARTAGLVLVPPTTGFGVRKRVRKLKEKQGYARDIMLIGSTGFGTFVKPDGELHQVLQNCRDAKIMLLRPGSEGAKIRATSLYGEASEHFNDQIKKSIDFLKDLRSKKQAVRLKLYESPPFLKLTILGEHLWVQHYLPGVEAEKMPKYAFRQNQDPFGLFAPFYQFFFCEWEKPNVPEYDFNTEELVYRDQAGNEVRRELLGTDHRAESLSDNDLEENGLASAARRDQSGGVNHWSLQPFAPPFFDPGQR
jgi:hypothetical protein